MIKIKIDFDIDDDFIKMFHRAGQHEFTLVSEGKLTLEETKEKLLECQETKIFQDHPRLGFLKVYDEDTLVGLSMPRKISEKEYKVWCLDPTKDYYRMGMIFIDEPYRGKGYAKVAGHLFKRDYQNLLWTIDPTNDASKKVANDLGLKHNANLYLKERQWRHTPWGHDRILEIWSN